jgi:hypothetical protein
LGAGKQDRLSDVLGFEHCRLCDALFGAAFADGELGLDAAGIDRPDLDSVRAEFLVQSLGKADLGKLGGAIDGLAREPVMDEIISTTPERCLIITGTTCRLNKNVERMLESIISAYSSALVSTRFL